MYRHHPTNMPLRIHHRILALAILFCIFINLTQQLALHDTSDETGADGTTPEDMEKTLEKALAILKEKKAKQTSRRPHDDKARQLIDAYQQQNGSIPKKLADEDGSSSEPEEYTISKRVVSTTAAEEILEMLDRDLPDSVIIKMHPWFKRVYADYLRSYLTETKVKPEKIEIIDKTINDRNKIIKVKGHKQSTAAASINTDAIHHPLPVAHEDKVIRVTQELPEAVNNLEFADVTNGSLRVLWKAPNRTYGVLDYYTLEYSESLVPDKRISQRVRASLNEAKVTDLSPQTSYTFEVFAHTKAGRGPGKLGEIRTRQTPVLPEPPTNLVASNVGPYSALITFKPGFDGHSNIEKWIVEALIPFRDDYTPSWQHIYTSTNHTQENAVMVHNLQPFTRYKIRLRPINIVGQSAEFSSQSTEFQTAQAPPIRAPADLLLEDLEAKSAIAHWTPLEPRSWAGEPLGYNLTWIEVDSSSEPVISHHFINGSLSRSLQVSDLEEFTEYSFRIYAINEAGSSPPSEPVMIMTHEGQPSLGPTNVTAHALSSNSIQIEWGSIPKRHRNGIIRGYKIQYQGSGHNLPLQVRIIEDNSTRQVILRDLKAFTPYRLAIAGYTAEGDGVYSAMHIVQTLEDTPGKPQNLTSSYMSKTSAQVLWDPPEEPNGDILGYKVSYNALTDGSKEIASHELQPNETHFKANNLKSDTHYVFTVTAKTKGGWGQQASILMYTYDSEFLASRTFYRENWFVLLMAGLSVVIPLLLTIVLFIQTRNHTARYNKQNGIKLANSQDRLGDAGYTIDDDIGHYNNGFGGAGMLPHSSGANNHRRSNGAISQSTANFTLPKTPPHPTGGSVVYSDDGDDDVFDEDIIDKPIPPHHQQHQQVKSIAGTSNYDDSSGDSLTEKPSEISSSTAEESEWPDDEYVNMANQRHGALTNHYANVNGGTLRSQKSWKKSGSISKSSTYSSHRTTKPKLPQRPAPQVPKVPGIGDPSSSSSDITANNNNQPMPGTSGMQHQQQHQQQRNSSSIYGDSQASSSRSQYSNGYIDSVDGPTSSQNNQNMQQQDLLDNHMGNLNGGRIIVNNMAGSRAPLPGFTSFV